MTDREKIEILFKEYEILRDEIVQRISNRFSFLTYAGAVATYAIFGVQTRTTLQTVVLIVAAVALLIIWYRFGLLIARCSHRIAELETEINGIAGAELLKWENQQHKRGLFHGFHW